ncbi:undecaprenyl-diphosphate phosphatase [Candidatus Pacearchaeota archaeon]|nr:undecaprenyl-diphosphate phosphatase [Candidatus Pacearchaeota archaeon]
MQLTIIQQVTLGIIQGITEWLPVSSSAFITLIMTNFFQVNDISFLLHSALLLHLGTFFAALIYFRKDVWKLTKSLFNYSSSDKKTKKVLNFLIISTIISGILGLVILKILTGFESQLELTGKTITFLIAVLLLFTGIIQIKTSSRKKIISLKKEKDITKNDSVILGLLQGLATLPGISRSGITVSGLLLKKFDDTTALKLSFLMSLPIVLIGNLILNFSDLTQIATSTSIYGLLASFIFGLATISGLMKLSKKINFGWFVLIFALLMFGSLLL